MTEDSAYRLELLEERAGKLEQELGLSSAEKNSSTQRKEKKAETTESSPSTTLPEQIESTPTEDPSPEALLAKAKDHLVAGREVAAEAALRRKLAAEKGPERGTAQDGEAGKGPGRGTAEGSGTER